MAEMTSDAREHAVQLLEVTESAMVESCRVAKQVRMSRNECDCRCGTGRARGGDAAGV